MTFFHRETLQMYKIVKRVLGIAIAPLLTIAVAMCAAVLLSVRFLEQDNILLPALALPFGVVFTGACIAAICLRKYYRAAYRESRYTYLDIEFKYIIFSRYNGEYALRKRRTILRKVYVIPIERIRSASVVKKKLVITTEENAVRVYGGDSEFLSYYFKGEDIKWKQEWYEFAGFTTTDSVTLPNIFGSAVKMYTAIIDARRQYNETPREREYKFKEMPYVKLQKMRKTRDENATYDRKW